MKTTKSILIVLSLVLLTAGAAQSMEQAKDISATSYASCLIQVTSDPAIFPINYETVEALLYSSGIGGKAAREILRISPDDMSDIFMIEILGSGGGISPPPASGMGTTGLVPKSSTGSRFSVGKSALGEDAGMDDYGMMMEYSPFGTSSRRSRSRTSSTGLDASRYYGRSTTTARKPGETTAQFDARRRAQAAARARAVARSRTTPTTSEPAPATAAISAVGRTSLLQLSVELPEEAVPAAEEFLKSIVDLFENSLNDSFQHHKNVLAGHRDVAEEEVELTENELRLEQDKLREISGSRALDRDEILQEIRSLRTVIENLEMQQVSGRLTVDATLKRIAEIEHKTKVHIAEDTVTAELQRMLELNAGHLQNAKKLFDKGATSMADMADAEEKLARAKIELARRREELSKSTGGNLIETLNMQLASSSIETAQDKAHLATYEQRLAEAEALLNKSGDYELISLRADIAKQNLREVLVWRDRISRHVRMLRPPAVSVLGGR